MEGGRRRVGAEPGKQGKTEANRKRESIVGRRGENGGRGGRSCWALPLSGRRGHSARRDGLPLGCGGIPGKARPAARLRGAGRPLLAAARSLPEVLRVLWSSYCSARTGKWCEEEGQGTESGCEGAMRVVQLSLFPAPSEAASSPGACEAPSR